MREHRQYSESFRQQALEKVYTRGSGTIEMVADDLNMSKGTLRNWMKADQNNLPARSGRRSRRPNDWSRDVFRQSQSGKFSASISISPFGDRTY